MRPKDFTIDCIINTVLEPAPPLYALKSIVNLKNLHKCLIYADFTLLV